MGKKLILAAVAPVIFALSAGNVGSDEFEDEDLDRWEEQFMQVVQEGRDLWTVGRVVDLWEMINWCLRNPLEGEEPAADDEKMIALIAYVRYERRGVELDPGKH